MATYNCLFKHLHLSGVRTKAIPTRFFLYYQFEKLLIVIYSSSILFTFTEYMINDGKGMIYINYSITIYH